MEYFKDAGSDVVNISTTASRDGDFFILNGSKAWVTSGHEAKAAIVFATVDRQLGHRGISGKILTRPIMKSSKSIENRHGYPAVMTFNKL